MSDTDGWICAICRQPLAARRPYGSTETTWLHPLGRVSDHAPEPAPIDDETNVDYCCDFCSDDAVEWIYSVTHDVTAIIASPRYTEDMRRRQIGRRTWVEESIEAPPEDLATTRSLGGWTACAACAELIELRDQERLITRVRRARPDTVGARPRTFLRALYGEFFRNIGPRRPARDTKPLE